MNRVLAKDLGAKGITVNTIAPGSVETELLHKGKSPEFVQRLASLNPQKRIPDPSEIAPIIAFLSSDEAGWVNGQTIFVNGVSRDCATVKLITKMSVLGGHCLITALFIS